MNYEYINTLVLIIMEKEKNLKELRIKNGNLIRK